MIFFRNIFEKGLYAKRHAEIKNNFDETQAKLYQILEDKDWKDIQPKVIKRSYKYPEIGDLFEYITHDNVLLHGLVLNNHLVEEDFLVIIIFKPEVDLDKIINTKIKINDLLLIPNKVSRLHWTKGYFHNIAHYDKRIKIDPYGFYNDMKLGCDYGFFEDENRKKLKSMPKMWEISAILTEFGLSYEIEFQLIVNKYYKN